MSKLLPQEDPNVKIPAAIKAASQRSDQIHAQAYATLAGPARTARRTRCPGAPARPPARTCRAHAAGPARRARPARRLGAPVQLHEGPL
jgi:hypothetical protein